MYLIVYICLQRTWVLLICPFFFFNDTAPTEIYTLSLHDALPISPGRGLLVYQPATEGLLGTCIVPRWVMPSRISLVRTPMAGIHTATGGGAVRVVGLGSGAGVPSGVRPADAALAGPGGCPGRPVITSSPATVMA